MRPSYREASEHTAAAALTELRNNNHQLKSSAHTTTASTNAIVTSILSKNHIDHLEANSVSVIPIDATNLNNASSNILAAHHTKRNRASIRKGPNATAATNLKGHIADSNSSSAMEMHRLTQLQQHLETAAVLMDISKKVIISPPSSNPQSPSVSEQAQSINAKRLPLKRTGNHEEVDLSTKRTKSTAVHIKTEFMHGKNNESANPYYLDNYVPHALKSVIIKNEPVFKEDIENDEINGTNQYESDMDSNDSDPDRLQMDISSSQEQNDRHMMIKSPVINNGYPLLITGDYHNDDDAGRGTSSPVKMIYKHNRSHNNKQQELINDAGCETQESNKSDDHRTDPATTQLWQALARTTGMQFSIHFLC